MGSGEGFQGLFAVFAVECSQRRKRLHQLIDEGRRTGAVFGPQPFGRRVPPFTLAPVVFKIGERGLNAGESATEIGCAKRGNFKRPAVAADIKRVEPDAA